MIFREIIQHPNSIIIQHSSYCFYCLYFFHFFYYLYCYFKR